LIQEINNVLNVQNNESNEYLKSKDVKHILGISTNTLQKLCVKKKISRTKVEGRFYYKKSDAINLLKGE
jgi:hypothetical protein